MAVFARHNIDRCHFVISDVAAKMTRVVEGRFAELRGYLILCSTVLRPGTSSPVFHESAPQQQLDDTAPRSQVDSLIEEGRRQIDAQSTALARIQTNAAALATLALVVLGFLLNGFAGTDGSVVRQILWWTSITVLVLGLLGISGILFSTWSFGRVSVNDIILQGSEPCAVANMYASVVQIGDITIAARTTYMRDAVFLLWLSALLFVLSLVSR
jgi:hypothetical protein